MLNGQPTPSDQRMLNGHRMLNDRQMLSD